MRLPISVVLYEPQIPQNTGNIGRLCVGYGTRLHLVEPFGFHINDAEVKRAGLDYWQYLEYQVHADFPSFFRDWNQKKMENRRRLVLLSTKGKKELTEHHFEKGDALLFGNEISGFPNSLSDLYEIERVRLPMSNHLRSYNLANSVAMAMYHAYLKLCTSSKIYP